MEPVTSLFEILHEPERFDLFAYRMQKHGWIAGEALGAVRQALQRPLTRKQLAELAALHNKPSSVLELSLHCNEINCGPEGFVCILYDGNRFETHHALYDELELHGYTIKRRFR